MKEIVDNFIRNELGLYASCRYDQTLHTPSFFTVNFSIDEINNSIMVNGRLIHLITESVIRLVRQLGLDIISRINNSMTTIDLTLYSEKIKTQYILYELEKAGYRFAEHRHLIIPEDQSNVIEQLHDHFVKHDYYGANANNWLKHSDFSVWKIGNINRIAVLMNVRVRYNFRIAHEEDRERRIRRYMIGLFSVVDLGDSFLIKTKMDKEEIDFAKEVERLIKVEEEAVYFEGITKNGFKLVK